MAYLTNPTDYIQDATERAVQTLQFEARRLAALQDPVLRKLIKSNPDATLHFSRWGDRYLELGVEITLRDADAALWDISALPGVCADDAGYNFTFQDDLPLTVGDGVPVRRSISVSQPYSQEERDLLTAVGKLTVQTNSYTYTALVCGV